MDNKLINVLVDVFDLKEGEISKDLTKDNVSNWDSLRQMDLIASLEEEFNITLEIQDIIVMTSVKSIEIILKEKGVL